jgi:cytochrome c-type biogenesis protein CcmH
MSFSVDHSRGLLLLLFLVMGSSAVARIDTYQFADPQQEVLYLELTQELRCLVCQNQNIADSNAELAKDLRRKTYEMVKKGQDKDQIVDFMVKRYGDFVMYKPPFKASTIILWLGPVIIFVLGLVVLIRIIRRRPTTTEPLLTDEQRRRAEKMLGDEGRDKDEDRDKDRKSAGNDQDDDSTGDKQ